ncbi:hypothetical protein RsoM2USA_403 [Ralstonia phage RsoM2USA]|nr:hypothetical protein RsoM2USA_403 [Ralstonia phage RsoM2USA]
MRSEMTFKAFLQETTMSDTSRVISLKTAAELVRQHCMDAYNQTRNEHAVLFRGIRSVSGKNALALETDRHVRTAAFTYNIVNLLMSNLPVWSDYPKRNLSAVCTNSERRANDYSNNPGEVFVVFPFNGTKIGQCSEYDLWESFQRLAHIGTVDFFAEILTDFMSEMVDKNFYTYSKNSQYDKVVASFAKLDAYAKKIGIEKFKEKAKENENGEVLFSKYKYALADYDGNFLESLSKLLDPTKNGFKITTAGHIEKSTDRLGKEMWFSGKAVAVPVDLMDKFMDLMDKYDNV